MEKIFVVLIIIWLFFCYRISVDNQKVEDNHVRFAVWSQKCINDGGTVNFMYGNGQSNHYECVKDGKFINHQD